MVVSCPPGCKPEYSTGAKLALDAYMAAVYPCLLYTSALNGKEITRGTIHSTTQLLDFSALEQGVYLLETEGQVLKFTLLP